MTHLKRSAATHLGYLGITVAAFIAINWLNEAAFLWLEQSNGVNWIFLPAGVRLLATLLFGFTGFVGLLLASIYLNFHHFVFQDEVRAFSGAAAASIGPYLAYLFAKHWFDLGPHLANLTARRLLVTGVLCGLMSPVLHHAFMWVQSGLVDRPALAAMITGDIVGILVVVYLAKGLIKLADPREVDAHLR